MPYLTREEQAILTMANTPMTGLAAQSGSIGLGIMMGNASNVFFAGVAGAKLKTMVTDIRTYSGKNISLAARISGESLDKAIADIMDTIDTGFNDIIGLTVDGLLASVGGMYASLRDNFAASSTLLNSYNGIIQSVGIDPFITRWVNTRIKPNIPSDEMAWFMRKIGAFDDAQYNAVLTMNGWGLAWKDVLDKAWTRPVTMEMLLNLARRPGFSVDDFKAQMRWYRISEPMIDKVADLITQIPEPYRIADFGAKGLLEDEQSHGAFKWFGMVSGWADIWKESQYILPNFGTLFELKWRGLISDAELDKGLRRSAMHPDFTAQLKGLLEMIPPSGDLVTMVVREAFEPKYVVEAPPPFAENMAKKGFTKPWSDRYWTAHFLPMPVEQAYDNLRRGYWNKEQFLELLRIADFHPNWREDIYNVAFNPPSIREMGYGYDVGAFTIEDIIKYRRWGGLSEEDAKKTGQAMVAYRTEAERNAVRTELMYAHGFGRITIEDFEEQLTLLGTAEEAVPYWISRAELYKQRIQKPSMDVEGLIISSSEAITAFKLGLRDETWLRSTLKSLDWADDRIQLAVEKAKSDIAPKPIPEPVITHQLLTAAQMQDLYFQGIIDEAFMSGVFIERGYTPEDAQLLVKVYTFVQETPTAIKSFTTGVAANMYYLEMFDEEDLYYNFRAQDYDEAQAWLLVLYTRLEQIVPMFKTIYAEGAIDDIDLRNYLISYGLEPDQATSLTHKIMEEVQVKRLSTEKDLTKAEIIKGVKNDVFSSGQGIELLVDLNYSEDEAKYILELNKVMAAGDPETFLEMKRVTDAYKQARGEKVQPIPDEAVALELQIRTVKAEFDKERKIGVNEEKIAELALQLSNLESRLRTVLTKTKVV